MSGESTDKKPKMAIGGIALAVIASIFVYAFFSDWSRNREIEETQDPARLAYLVLDYADEDAKSLVKVSGTHLDVSFNLGELSFSTSESDYLSTVHRLLGKLFAASKITQTISVTGMAEVTDIRGHNSTEPVFVLNMARSEAEKIAWENVDPYNLPQLASEYWRHPSLSR